MVTDPHKKIAAFKDFIQTFAEITHPKELEDEAVVNLDLKALREHNPDLASDVLEEPEEHIKLCKAAAEDLEIANGKQVEVLISNAVPDVPKGWRPETVLKVRDIRSEHHKKLKVFNCLVKQQTFVFSKVTSTSHTCLGCHSTINMLQTSEHHLKKPSKCGTCEGTRFSLTDKSKTDYQVIQLEDEVGYDDSNVPPGSIDAILEGKYLTKPERQHIFLPGERVKVTATITDVPKNFKKPNQTMPVLQVHGIEPVEKRAAIQDINEEEKQKITETANSPDVLEKMAKYVAPNIYGYTEVKKAIVLQLLGGKERRTPGRTKRGRIHMLLIGEPSLGKSQILQWVKGIVPRANYVGGGSASGVGLTASVIRDEFTGAWAIAAGAMALSNNSVLAVDEFDKIAPDEQKKLHEAMEQGSVSVSKASVTASVPANTAILAAANPIYGRFSDFETKGTQLGLTPTLTNRFDLIFPFVDEVDEERDRLAADRIFTAYDGAEDEEDVDYSLFVKHIKLGREVKPQLSEQVTEQIMKFFSHLRNYSERQKNEGRQMAIPISYRQLEGIVRLAQAHAKLRFSTVVEEQDAQQAIDLMMFWLRKLGMNPETGTLDVDMIEIGSEKGMSEKVRILRSIIHTLASQMGKKVPIEDVMREAKEKKIEEYEVDDIVEKLKQKGDLIEPTPGYLTPL